MRKIFITLLLAILFPLLSFAEVNWQFQAGGMFYGRYFGDSYSLTSGLFLQIPLSKQTPIFLETGLDYRYINGSICQLDGSKFYPNHSFTDGIDLYDENLLELPVKVGYKLVLNEKNAFEFCLGPYISMGLGGGATIDGDFGSINYVGLNASVGFRHRCMTFGLTYHNPVFLNKYNSYYTNSFDLTVGINFGSRAWSKIGEVALITTQVAGGVASAYVQSQGQGSSYTPQLYDTETTSETNNSRATPETPAKTQNVSEHQAYLSEKNTYGRYESLLATIFSGNRESSCSEVRKIQAEMKRIREKWQKRGKTFYKAANETRSCSEIKPK